MALQFHFCLPRTRLLQTLAISAQCCALLACASTPQPPVAQATTPQSRFAHIGFVYGPYKHLNIAVNLQNPVATTQVLGTPQVLAGTPRAVLMPGAQALTLAFASGECGQERWGDLSAQAVAHANVDTLTRAALPYIISAGGEGSIFTCGSDAAMEQFVARYESPMLLGFDYALIHHSDWTGPPQAGTASKVVAAMRSRAPPYELI